MQGSIGEIGGDRNFILGDDGGRYSFDLSEWRDGYTVPTIDARVEFEVVGSAAVGIYPLWEDMNLPDETVSAPVEEPEQPLSDQAQIPVWLWIPAVFSLAMLVLAALPIVRFDIYRYNVEIVLTSYILVLMLSLLNVIMLVHYRQTHFRSVQEFRDRSELMFAVNYSISWISLYHLLFLLGSLRTVSSSTGNFETLLVILLITILSVLGCIVSLIVYGNGIRIFGKIDLPALLRLEGRISRSGFWLILAPIFPLVLSEMISDVLSLSGVYLFDYIYGDELIYESGINLVYVIFTAPSYIISSLWVMSDWIFRENPNLGDLVYLALTYLPLLICLVVFVGRLRDRSKPPWWALAYMGSIIFWASLRAAWWFDLFTEEIWTIQSMIANVPESLIIAASVGPLAWAVVELGFMKGDAEANDYGDLLSNQRSVTSSAPLDASDEGPIETVLCLFCAEEILQIEAVCPYCGSDLPADAGPS